MIKTISITGGIGSGKSSVMNILKQLGYCVWDADVFAAQAMKKSDVEMKIKALLGNNSYLSPGVLNRGWVRTQVFGNATLRKELEDILHPVIEHILVERLKIMEIQDVSCWVFYEASLIFEKKRHTFFDANILVTVDDNKRIQRVHKNKKLPIDLIEQIIKQQMSTSAKLKFADYTIDNSSTRAQLERKVLKLVQFLKKKFQG